ncbi:hypothetical protein C4585_00620 [Candidatus Parcubacteria bacterium]|nr:MAG: hypothetical protein C4585_00620 [Candidatus Parcubacteria bacterium]
MSFDYFSKNGELLPVQEAAIPLSNIEYQYGFGVYESIRVVNKTPYFLKQHLERLQESARFIELEHPFSAQSVANAISNLIEKNTVETCNLKILLIGGKTKDEAALYILCLNPLFPDKKLYRDGAHCITYAYERLFPHAKTLNMLGSYLAYRKAREVGAYDTLLINRSKEITEGTRTNFYCIKGKTVISPPAADVLPGVTQLVLKKVLEENEYAFTERSIPATEIETYDGAFLTSTSSKVLPIRTIDSTTFPSISPELRALMSFFDEYVEKSRGTL